jgi:hypothetical protein
MTAGFLIGLWIVVVFGFVGFGLIGLALIKIVREHAHAINSQAETLRTQEGRLEMHQERLDYQRESLDGQRALTLGLKGDLHELERQVGRCTCRMDVMAEARGPIPLPDANCPIHGM